MTKRTLIQNGTVYFDGALRPLDILIADDKVQAVGMDLAVSDATVIDATGLLVSPGFIDLHVHFREPGQTEKETVVTGSRAAAHGGFTTVAAMPNTTPAPDTPERVAAMRAKNATDGAVRILQYGCATTGRTGDTVTDFVALKQAGAFAFSNDGNGVQTAGTMYRALQAAAQTDSVLAAHIEDDSLSAGGVMTESDQSAALGLPGQPAVSETAQLARDLVLVAATGARYHACHVSTRQSLDLIRLAKQQGLPVTCEVTPHHLTLSLEDITADDAMYKMNPPLRAEADRQALIAGLLDGTIDAIATDHAPHTDEEKAGSMQTAPFGIIGLDFAFSLLYTKLVQPGLVSLETLLEKLTAGPARAFRLEGLGTLTPGAQADIVLIDLADSWTVTKETLRSKAHNTPHLGATLNAVIKQTLVSGASVYRADGL